MLLGIGLFLVLGTVTVVGSLLPAAKAAPAPVPAQYTTPVVPQALPAVPAGASPYFVLPRWQIITITNPDRSSTVTILLDSNTGESFLLTPMPGRSGYVWESINRGVRGS
jgi:hypothetical protein